MKRKHDIGLEVGVLSDDGIKGSCASDHSRDDDDIAVAAGIAGGSADVRTAPKITGKGFDQVVDKKLLGVFGDWDLFNSYFTSKRRRQKLVHASIVCEWKGI